MGEFRNWETFFIPLKQFSPPYRWRLGCSLVGDGVEERGLLLSSCVKKKERGGRGEYIFYCVFTERDNEMTERRMWSVVSNRMKAPTLLFK